jgi:hypothetical protein
MGLLLLIPRTKVEALAVHHMLSCFPAIFPRFSTLMSYNVDGVECLMAAAYDVLFRRVKAYRCRFRLIVASWIGV